MRLIAFWAWSVLHARPLPPQPRVLRAADHLIAVAPIRGANAPTDESDGIELARRFVVQRYPSDAVCGFESASGPRRNDKAAPELDIRVPSSTMPCVASMTEMN